MIETGCTEAKFHICGIAFTGVSYVKPLLPVKPIFYSPTELTDSPAIEVIDKIQINIQKRIYFYVL